jgi:hypothetical protein
MAQAKKKVVRRRKKVVVKKTDEASTPKPVRRGDPNLILKIMETVAIAREQGRALYHDDFEKLCSMEETSSDRRWLADLPFGPGTNYNNVARTLMNRFEIVERPGWPGLVTPRDLPPAPAPPPPAEDPMAPPEPEEPVPVPTAVDELEVGKEPIKNMAPSPPQEMREDDSPIEGEIVNVPKELEENIDNELGVGDRG